MKLESLKTGSKGKKIYIEVLSKGNKIMVNKQGLVIITDGNHNHAEKVRSDIIESGYIFPKGAYLDD